MAFFRKKASLSGTALKSIRAQANIVLSQVRTLLSSVEYPPLRVPQINFQEFGNSAEAVAQALRTRWHVPPGPIDNVIRVVESAGIIVIKLDLGTNQISGLSLFEPRDAMPPIIIINEGLPGDRLRFTVAHEMVHIILHHHLPMPPEDSESQAHQVAGAFLMPRDEIRGYMNRLSLPVLASLKLHWKVAMQAIIMRAFHLGKITERQRYYLFAQITQRGFRLKEPIEIPLEEPSIIKELIEYHLSDLGYTREEMGEAIGLVPSEFAAQYLKERSGIRLVTTRRRDPK